MKTIKLFNADSNTTVSLTVSPDTSKAELFRMATVKGAEIGRTSFNKLVDGKVTQACGWVLVEETTEEVEAVELQDLQNILEAAGVACKLKVAKTETYLTFQVPEGRVQANPVKSGFSLMFFPRKGFGPDEITRFGEVKAEDVRSQYTRLPVASTKEIVDAISK